MCNYHKDGTTPVMDTVFVFGSNLRGAHGAGAAWAAHIYFGAKMGDSEGMTGLSYAIPTKDADINTLPVETIKDSIEKFIEFAKSKPNTEFWVTRIGCGLAGLKDATIAPMFKNAPSNCNMPDTWKEFLED